ncbi:uncharacterized protein PSFLO_01632 [Pseudozyma flocculosa]|uniref:Uncharacterized protein n=1 Tax=Pseudozyma flocculosa TaxID=84751 RepID=A0A5C3EYR3_9BASI|nr:uncharacterized protein PSFLO_01632 [Pseudozyma flocculosa]
MPPSSSTRGCPASCSFGHGLSISGRLGHHRGQPPRPYGGSPDEALPTHQPITDLPSAARCSSSLYARASPAQHNRTKLTSCPSHLSSLVTDATFPLAPLPPDAA